MGKRSAAGLLTSVDSIFTTQEERDNAQRSYVTDLPAAEISDFPNHPFKVRMDQSMVELAESVKQHGVLVPSLVRPMPDGSYQMVSGHRRKRAAELADLPTVPCIIRELTDDEAIIVMVDSNLQREQILPSEKAFAYKMKLEAMKRQGQRTDLTSVPVAQKSGGKTSRQLLGEQVGESQDQIRRYIRLTNLIPELLDMVDNSVLKEAGKLQMALRPAVELSYLPEAEQTALLEVMEGEIRTPSHAQAIKMRSFSEQGKLNPDVILSIMQEEKPNQVEQFKIPRERIDKFFKPGTPAQKIEDTISASTSWARATRWRRSDRVFYATFTSSPRSRSLSITRPGVAGYGESPRRKSPACGRCTSATATNSTSSSSVRHPSSGCLFYYGRTSPSWTGWTPKPVFWGNTTSERWRN